MNGLYRGDLTHGGIAGTMLRFAFPMMLGNLLQQCYNLVDTLIVGRVLGAGALAAVGSSYTLMVFITSIFIGLCMGSGAVYSIQFGAKDIVALRRSIYSSVLLVGLVTLVLNIAFVVFLTPIIHILQTPAELEQMMYQYLIVIAAGMIPVCVYNFYSYLLRAVGNSVAPLIFLIVSVILNIGLDLLFIISFGMGIAGAAWATVVSQVAAAVGIAVYSFVRFPELRLRSEDIRFDMSSVKRIASFSFLTCIQQSVMNFGILMVQGLVNSFGTVVMAAFAVAVKIDTLAYMPVQDFGNAFSTFIAQNFGAGEKERIRRGISIVTAMVILFSMMISAVVIIFAPQLMGFFVEAGESELVSVGVDYLRIEGSFYFGIGILFLLYGFYRAIALPWMSVILTILSLGTRVALAYILAAVPWIGVYGIWWSIPIGWALADGYGIWYYIKKIRGRAL